jgi:hypothetical protein
MIPMKTNASLKILKLATLAPLAIAITAALMTQPVRADVINTLVITENSPTSLTATYSNGTATVFPIPNNPDLWQILLPGNASFNNIAVSWTEPENPGQVNTLSSGAAAQAFFGATLLLAVRRSQTAPRLTTSVRIFSMEGLFQ